MTEGIKEQEEGKIKEPVCIEAIRTNASGMICFGIILEKNTPWNHKRWRWNIDKWWLETVHKFQSSVKAYDVFGKKLKTASEEDTNIYWEERRNFMANMPPLRYEAHIFGCEGNRKTILALKGTYVYADAGGTATIDPKFFDIKEEEYEEIKRFCQIYRIPTIGEPGWILHSYTMKSAEEDKVCRKCNALRKFLDDL